MKVKYQKWHLLHCLLLLLSAGSIPLLGNAFAESILPSPALTLSAACVEEWLQNGNIQAQGDMYSYENFEAPNTDWKEAVTADGEYDYEKIYQMLLNQDTQSPGTGEASVFRGLIQEGALIGYAEKTAYFSRGAGENALCFRIDEAGSADLMRGVTDDKIYVAGNFMTYIYDGVLVWRDLIEGENYNTGEITSAICLNYRQEEAGVVRVFYAFDEGFGTFLLSHDEQIYDLSTHLNNWQGTPQSIFIIDDGACVKTDTDVYRFEPFWK